MSYIDNGDSAAVVTSVHCTGPNAACRAAHRAGRSVHVIPSHHDPKQDTHGRLVMATYHYFTAQAGIAAVEAALRDARTVSSDEEWLETEAAHEVSFRTIPGVNHPTRR